MYNSASWFCSPLATALLLALGAVVPCSKAHRPAINGAGSCGDDYGTSGEALPLADPTISWAFKHYLDCTHRAVWVSFENPSPDQQFYVGVSVPPRNRFADIRADALIIGPELPKLSEEAWESLPEEVRDDPIWTNNPAFGAYYHQSPQDQSTCDHLGVVMKEESSVVDGRCNFFEPFGKTNSWRLLDADNNSLPVAGASYYVAVFLQDNVSSKLGIALGTWVEDFITQHDLSTPGCSRDLSDFSEKEGLQADCFPVVSCSGTDGPVAGCVNEETSDKPICELGQVCGEADGCEVAGVQYQAPTMGACGGQLCPAAVQTWEEVNMKMHMGMMDLEYTGNPDIDFVRGMIPHHVGAVDMCRVLIENLTCTSKEDVDNLEGLVHFCNHIQLEQEIEVGAMRRWLEENNLSEKAPCSAHAAASRHGGDMMAMPSSCGEVDASSSRQFIMLNHQMHDLMAIEYSCNHTVDFVRMMMPHHASAVDMCDIVMESTEDDFVVELCSNITLTQRAEISWMYDWLEARNYDVTAACGDCDLEPMMEPCEDTLSTSSFCHGLSGTSQDGYCRCEDTLTANNYTCGEPAWVDGLGLFMPEEYCARTCGVCPVDIRPLWIPGCENSGHSDEEMDAHGDHDQMDENEMEEGSLSNGASSARFVSWVIPGFAVASCLMLYTMVEF